MATRKNYLVTLHAPGIKGRNVLKHAWNTARQCAHHMAIDYFRSVGAYGTMDVQTESLDRPDKWTFNAASYLFTLQGKTCRVTVVKQPEFKLAFEAA